MPDYEVVPEEETGKVSRRRRAKPRMPAFTIERYGGRLIYFWFGMRFGDLMKLFARGRYSFTLNCIPDVLALFLWVPWNSVLYWISEAKYRRAAQSLKLDNPPIFVIGHWRTGTTFLHDLFSVDPSLAYPTTFECFFPHHFLLTEDTLPKVMKVLLPKKRPQDDVPVGFDRPQEEEFAMMMLGAGTPYITHAWPRFGPADTDYLDFKGLSEKDKETWVDAYMWLYRRLYLKHGEKRLVMKTPANAARLKLLTKLFPDARYVYLARNPLDVFPSTVKLWRALYSTQGLHNPPRLDPWLDDYVLDMFARLTEDYEEDRHLIPEGHLVELRYEDFVRDPVATMRDIYRRLDIKGFDQAEAPMREFIGERKEHRVSHYELPEKLKRKVIDRLKPYIDRFGYRAAVERMPETIAKAPAREKEPS
ncbi:MAG TPA: sulfotransferase [Methyloceanibacter sp.]|nr:sulfotransferase [Methyloceanibacter sp.]